MQLWRLTRNRYGRAVYDALADRGVTATSMIEYVAELGDETQIPDEGRFTVERTPPERVDPLDAPTAELLADESVVAAFDGETPLGYLFCSVDATHEIHPLERRVQFDGAYVRRVYVDPSHRNRGVATRLVADALARASDRGRSGPRRSSPSTTVPPGRCSSATVSLPGRNVATSESGRSLTARWPTPDPSGSLRNAP
ncbi:GNAT family N-acetyltransferase [Halomicroarcula sp. GCM10025709]|uniref:GNAT family N-acetyltransferase n=1 Tax=Halomicroarcula sp. GCM10025709 TaxID=3252669 RepID=UPI003612031A